MKPVAEMYRASFFKNRHKLNWRVPVVCSAIENTFHVFKGLKGKSSIKIIDVGCAIGDYVEEFNRRGYTAFGIEGSIASKQFACTPKIVYCDLREKIPFEIVRAFDICYSLEVAEHIEEEFAEQYVKNLVFLSNIILITAAGPGQEGHGHFNLKHKWYWVDMFAKFNFDRDIKSEDIFKNHLEKWKRKVGINAYYKNCMIFRRRM